MSRDPLKASMQCTVLIALVTSGIVCLTGWGIEDTSGGTAVLAALMWGITITVELAVLAVVLWVLSGLFK
jgi:hypothetical protein